MEKKQTPNSHIFSSRQTLSKKRSRSLSPSKRTKNLPSNGTKNLAHSKTDTKLIEMDDSRKETDQDSVSLKDNIFNEAEEIKSSRAASSASVTTKPKKRFSHNNSLKVDSKENLLLTPSCDYHLQLPMSGKSSPVVTPSSACSSARSDKSNFFDKNVSPISPNGEKTKLTTTVSQIKNFLAPNHSSRNEEFKKLFKPPETEKFIVAYSCAYQREILCQGRMYVSQNLLCFHANIFTWETTIVISYKEIECIKKKKTAKVIPNAIEITTKNGEILFFTSFTARSRTYKALTKIYENSHSEHPLQAEELRYFVNGKLEDDVSGSQDEADIDEETNDYSPRLVKEPDLGGCDIPALNLGNLADTPAAQLISSDGDEICENAGKHKKRTRNPSLMLNIPTVIPRLDNDLSDSSENDGELSCTCESHLGREVINEVFPISVDQMFLLIFTSNPGYLKFQEGRKTKDLILNEWEEDKSSGIQTREITYTTAVNNPMGPKTCGVIEKQVCSGLTKNGRSYTVKGVCHQLNIPYCDTFDIGMTYCMSRVSSNKCRLRGHGGTIYRKSCWGLVKAIIEKNAAIGINGYYADLLSFLRTECSNSCDLPEVSKKRTSVQALLKVPKSKSKTGKSSAISPTVDNPKEHKKSLPCIQQLTAKPQIETLTKSILLILIAMLILNAALFYKLWYFEAESERISFETSLNDLQKIIDNPNGFPGDWFQQIKNSGIHQRWKESKKFTENLIETISTVKIIEKALIDLKRHIKLIQSEIKTANSHSEKLHGG